MLTVPPALIPKLHTIADTGAWLLLIEVTVPSFGTYRFCYNNDDIVWPLGGNNYQAFPFELDEVKEDGKGALPSFAVRVSNVTRALEYIIDASNGLAGGTFRLLCVHSQHLGETTAALDETFSIVGCSVSAQWVTIRVGAENPQRSRSPRSRYLNDHCRYKIFKGTLCGYTGSTTSCNRTFSRCRQLGNVARFGGFPGILGANYV